MQTYKLQHPSNPERDVFIRAYEPEDEKALIETLGKRRVQLIKATDAEIEKLESVEQDQEAHDPDVAYTFPDDILVLDTMVNEWSNPMSLAEILHVVTSEAANGCMDSYSAFDYLTRRYKERLDVSELRALLRTLNFAALRENHAVMYALTLKEHRRTSELLKLVPVHR